MINEKNENYYSNFITNKKSNKVENEFKTEKKPNEIKKYFFDKNKKHHLKQRKKSLDINEEKIKNFLQRQNLYSTKISKNVEKMKKDKFDKDTNYLSSKIIKRKSLNEIINNYYYKEINKKEKVKYKLMKKFNSSDLIRNKNLNSERLLNNMKQKMYDKIFNVLDSDKDNFISPFSIQSSIKDIPSHMMKILFPIFNKFKNENITLSKNEFFLLLNNVFDNLDFENKKIFVREYGDNSRLKELIKFNEEETNSKIFYFNPKIDEKSKNIGNKFYRNKSYNKSFNKSLITTNQSYSDIIISRNTTNKKNRGFRSKLIKVNTFKNNNNYSMEPISSYTYGNFITKISG